MFNYNLLHLFSPLFSMDNDLLHGDGKPCRSEIPLTQYQGLPGIDQTAFAIKVVNKTGQPAFIG